jgi:signal transduction histidine kinase
MNARPRILIVDDSPEDCVIYQRQLENGTQKSFTFEFAHSAEKGLEHCRTELPDCVLLDYNLPDHDGLDFLASLREEHGESRPPVVMLTGKGTEAIAVKAMKLGAQDYLVKGSAPENLRHSVKNAIAYALLRRELEAQQRELARLSLAQQELIEQLRRHAEELSAADRRKNEFLAILAHELRNPLGPIRNAAHVIRLCKLPLPPEAEQARDVIDRQVDHMVCLIEDLLDVSRIVRGKILLRKSVLDLGKLIRSTIADHGQDFDERELAVTLSMPASETWIDGDPTRLVQVLGNILDNACKFTPAGGTITVTLSAPRAQGTARIVVADSGEGIEPEMVDRIFETFSQADRSLDRSRGGLGLGLAIVKGLVELHGGTVAAASGGPGRGCEISVTLPLAVAPGTHAATPSPASTRETALRILVIEDNHDAAVCLRLLLEKLGHRVAVAGTGSQALELARENPPELVLCDIGLSEGMSGYEVAECFRQDPALASAFLVALTGYGRDEDRTRAKLAGFDLHCTKPIALELLREILSKVPGR